MCDYENMFVVVINYKHVFHTLICSGMMTASCFPTWFTSIQPKAELAVREIPSNSTSASSPPPADHLSGKVYQSIRAPPLLAVVGRLLSCDVDGRGWGVCAGWKEGEEVVWFSFVASVISLCCDAYMNKVVPGTATYAFGMQIENLEGCE